MTNEKLDAHAHGFHEGRDYEKRLTADAMSAILKDVCEVDVTGKWNRDDNTDRVVITVQKLEAILRAHLVESLER